MAEASKTSGKIITTAGFIEKFNISQKAPPKKLKPDQDDSPSKIESPPSSAGPSTNSNDTSNMEGLSDSDLQTLLQNFKDLSTEEQHGLITYLKKLEAKEPERVERLRKFVNLGSGQSTEKSSRHASPNEKDHQRMSSPFSIRLAGTNPTIQEKNIHLDEDDEEKETETAKKEQIKIKIDSDDEDYSYEDVFKAAKQRVTEKELEKERQLVEDTIKREPKTQVDLSDAKALIANIMENINRKDANLMGLQNIKPSTKSTEAAHISPANIVGALDTFPLNVSNLADIVGNIQSMEQKNAPNSADLQKAQHSPKPHVHNVPPQRPNQNIYQGPNPSFPQNPRNPFNAPQNVQYPLKNQYANYPQNMGYPNQHHQQGASYPANQGGYGRGQNNPYNRFNNPDFNNRGGNAFNNRNYGGNNRW